MSQKIRIKLKSYDHKLVDKSAEKIVKAVKAGEISFKHVLTFNMDEYVGLPER